MQLEQYVDSTGFPTLLVVIIGPYAGVWGAYRHYMTVIEPLTDLIHCGISPSRGNSFAGPLKLARLFLALRNATASLQLYYEMLMNNRKLLKENTFPPDVFASEPCTHFFPCFREIQVNGIAERLVYEEVIGPITERLVYVAKRPNQEDVIVKFSEQYGVNVHEILANEDLAPKLYYAQKLDCGFWMVVMENIKGARELPLELEPRVKRSIVDAVRMVHNQGYVFGDLRRPNILLDGKNKIKLIDFDWCGVLGEAAYPACGVNRNHAWPNTVNAGSLISKEEDEWCLKNLNLL